MSDGFVSEAALMALADGFGGTRVIVVGDLMLDRYLTGHVGRISPEAPVPVVSVTGEAEHLGGAANVALNLAELGLRVDIIGVTGQDADAVRLNDLARNAGLGVDGVLSVPMRPTTTKTRVLGAAQQMIRLDAEETSALAPEVAQALMAAVRRAFEDPPAVLVLSDYAKGVLVGDVCQALIVQARDAGVRVLVDPKGTDVDRYVGATALTPNLSELAMALGTPGASSAVLMAGGIDLRRRLGLEFLAVTRGAGGITLLDDAGENTFPAQARDVFDVSGAGDTVIAVLAAGMSVGLEPNVVLPLANAAAGLVVARVGTVPVNREELSAALARRTGGSAAKVLELAELQARVQVWRKRGERVAFTNGVFDLLHHGHVDSLEQARAEGDRLVVGVNADASVRRLKGSQRPVVGEAERARVVAALECVDAVVIFPEDTPLEVIRAVRPDVLVKGGDYREDEVVGATEVRDWGGHVVLTPISRGVSTSNLVERIRERGG